MDMLTVDKKSSNDKDEDEDEDEDKKGIEDDADTVDNDGGC